MDRASDAKGEISYMCRWRLSLIVLASLLANAQEPRGVNFFSKEKEAALGAALAAQVRKQSTIVESDALGQYVEKIGRKLAGVLPDHGITYTCTVVEGDLGGSTNEPLALPGGYIFLPANLFFSAHSDAEFAGMLAHAIAHVAARHGTRLATRAQVRDSMFLPAMYLNLSLTDSDDERLRDLQRSFELEADQMTVGMLAGAGYAPQAFADYIVRRQSDSLVPRDERLANIRSAIQKLPPDELPHMQDELHRLLPGEQRFR
jgi:predicted Zn-dependent protease